MNDIDGILHAVTRIVIAFSSFTDTFFRATIADLLKDYSFVVPDFLSNLTLFEILFGVGFAVLIVVLFIKFILDLWPG